MKISIFIYLYFLVMLIAPIKSNTGSERGDFKIITFQELELMLNQDSEKLRIYNFWATWCAPCVKEMPYFEKASQEDDAIELVFISMDDGRKPERVTDFIEKRNIESPVFLLDDVDYNKWINKVNPEWSEAIPATLFIKPDGQRHFHEGELEESELNNLIKQLN